MNVSNSKKIGLFCWFLLNLFCAAWTADLVQVNRETLFLTREGNVNYDHFKSLVDERRVLAVKLELPEDRNLDETLYTQVRSTYSSLKDKYSGELFSWMDFQDIYGRAIGDLKFDHIQDFAKKNPKLVMPILGPHHAGFLLMIDQKIEDRVITQLMSDILHAPWPGEFKVYPGGLPYINVKLNEYAEDIKRTLIPLMVIVSMLLTWWLTRSKLVAILLTIPAVFSLLQTLALSKVLYGSLNMVTAVVPLMMFVINLMVCFHLFYAVRGAGTFSNAWRIKKIPLVLSILTMAVGFLANLVSEVPVIRQFAVVSTVSVMVTALMSGLGLFLLEPWLQARPNTLSPRMFNPNWFKTRFSSKVIGMSSIAILGLLFFVVPRLELLTDATRYFPESSGLRAAIQRVEKDFLGTPAFELLVQKEDQSPLIYNDQKNMRSLELDILNAMGPNYKIFSLGSLLTEANFLVSGVEAFPPQRITWTMLHGGLPESVRSAFPSSSVYRISLMGTTMNSDVFREELKKLQTLSPKFTQMGYRIEWNGLNYQLMKAQDELVSVMAEGFGVTLLTVTLLFAATFRRLSVVLRFLRASLLPIAIGVISIYVLGFSLNIATVMTFSIALGMIVDNSFHMAWNVARERSFEDYYADTIVPIVGSGIILGFGFGLFAINGFLPIRQVGVLVAVMLVAGISASLFILNPKPPSS